MTKKLLLSLSLLLSPFALADGGLPSTEYQVKIGDTFESIAKKQLGDSGRAKEIKKLNPFDAENGLKIGSSIYLPDPKPQQQKTQTAVTTTPSPIKPATTPQPALDDHLYKFTLVLGHDDGQAQIYKNGEFFAVNAPVRN